MSQFSSPRRAGWSGMVLVGLLLMPALARGAEPALPPDLDLVPRDAAGFVHFRTTDLWKADMLADMRHVLKQAGPEALAAFEKKCPVAPETIDRLTLVFPTVKILSEPFPTVDPEAVSALVIVHTTKPYSRFGLMAALGYREKVYRTQLYHFDEELWSGLYFVDAQTFMVGSEDALIHYFEQTRTPRPQGPLQAALEAAAGKHHVVLGLNPALLGKDGEMPPLPATLQPLLEARCAIFTLNLDKTTRIDLRLDYAGEEQAKTGVKSVRAALDLARAGLAGPIKEMEDQLYKDPKKAKPGIGSLPENFGALLAIGFLRELDVMMKDAAIEQKGATVHLPVQFSRLYSGNSGMIMLYGGGVFAIGRAASRTFTRIGAQIGGGNGKDPHEEHLRKLADALERHRQDKGAYPAPATYDKAGRPLLSWRVAMLPYLGEEALHKEFRLDEPWDSLHNKKLIKKLPQCLTTSERWDRRPGKTSDLVFTGTGTIFEGKNGVRKETVADKTILLIQTGSGHEVYWTKPADLAYHAEKPLPELFNPNGGPVRVLLADGTYKVLEPSTDEATLRELIRRQKKSGDKPKK